MAQWVNQPVSIVCKDTSLYQGLVAEVDSVTSAVTIREVIKNGLPYDQGFITLLSSQISDLSFIKTTPPIQKIVQAQPVASGSEDTVTKQKKEKRKPVKVVRGNTVTDDELEHRQAPRRRSNSFTFADTASHQSHHGHNSPRRSDQPHRHSRQRPYPGGQADCFNVSLESCQGDFDFQKNLDMFNKEQVFQEIENGPGSRHTPKKPDRYKHDEMIIKPSKPTSQIKLINHQSEVEGSFSYTTDDGLVIPCITADRRHQLFAKADIVGYSEQRRIEMVGRNTSDMVFQLIGGSNRLNPRNNHQIPTVVLFCGPHVQGCYGLNCARHLANHNIKTIVYIPPLTNDLPDTSQQELTLYELCGKKTIHRTEDLPTGAVDLIINCLDNPFIQSSAEPWYKYVTNWCNTSRAHVLAIDPLPSGCLTHTKWSVHIGLPQQLPKSAGQTYLCDIALPNKLFDVIGVRYRSPFGIKFCIPLHNELNR